MSHDDTPETDGDDHADGDSTRERLHAGVEEAVDGFDRRLIDLLAWLLETETRARIYVYLRQHPKRTSEEIATGTGLYPSTVREAIVELHDEDVVTRHKRASEGAGNNPYEYEAIPPSELVRSVADQVQDELNAVLCLDDYLSGDDVEATDAVTIEIDDPDTDAA